MPDGITSIQLIDSWGNSPAKTHRPSGAVYINRAFVPLLNADQWAFVLAHEEGHIKENTRDELRADELASRKYFSEKRSPKQSVKALSDFLPFTSPEHHERLKQQFLRAARHDCHVNNHQKSCAMLERIIDKPENRISVSNFNDPDESNMIDGIVQGVGAITGGIGMMVGSKKNLQAVQAQGKADVQVAQLQLAMARENRLAANKPQKDNTGLIIGVVVAVLLVAATGYFFMTRKKS
jgi:tetrahydromethanopterin S-methyltransferase subunit F